MVIILLNVFQTASKIEENKNMKKTLLFLVAVLLSLPLRADEGMWLLPLLRDQKIDEMKALGLKLQDYDIYSSENASLKDAVVIFGGGCTGEVVSPDGLVLTNHHCGYSAIQKHSSVEHDYLTDGFWAMTREQELPNEGLTVTFIDKIEDVTEYVKAELAKETDPNSMNFLSPKFLNALAKERVGEKFLQDNPGTKVEILPIFDGNLYYMFTKKIYSDIRLVGAPPSSIGKFGSDTDNWMWPRHTGDFSVFRIYADANGNPAPYSENNVPLRPKRWMKISIKGFSEGDFAMIMGFPGRTNHFYTSWEVAERRDIDNAVRIEMRELRQNAMLEEMLKDAKTRIQYASKYAGSQNAYKNSIGSNWAINKRDFEMVKQAEQDALIAWGKQYDQPQYEAALTAIRQMVEDRRDLRFRKWMLDEAILRGIEFASVPTQVDSLKAALQDENQKEITHQLEKLRHAFQRFFNKDYSPEVDRKIAKVMLSAYRSRVETDSQPEYFSIIDKDFHGDVNGFIDTLFQQSIYGSEANFDAFFSHPTVEVLDNDPMLLFAQSVRAEQNKLNQELQKFDDGYNRAHRVYVEGLMKMNDPKNMWPDANFTLRLTYGQIKGYSPRDCAYYGCQTTLDGVMEKEDSTNWEFVVPQRLKELYNKKDFGPYVLPNGKMPVALCATTHTTGGNSGSPVMNANGELIGINFDRNWEGVGGDIEYLPDYQRSIIVDIRYVLFLIEKYAGADFLINEMDIIK